MEDYSYGSNLKGGRPDDRALTGVAHDLMTTFLLEGQPAGTHPREKRKVHDVWGDLFEETNKQQTPASPLLGCV